MSDETITLELRTSDAYALLNAATHRSRHADAKDYWDSVVSRTRSELRE